MARSRSYRVSLSPVERKKIQHAKWKANSDNRRVRYAIILAADEKRYGHALTYKKITAKAGASIPTVVDTLKKFCTGGITKAVTPLRNPNSNSDTSRLKVAGADEARIIAKACSAPPEGYCRWTLKLLDQEVILEEPVSISTIGRVQRNNALHPHLGEYWCIPPERIPSSLPGWKTSWISTNSLAFRLNLKIDYRLYHWGRYSVIHWFMSQHGDTFLI